MLANLNAQGISPVIACPSESLHTVLPVAGSMSRFCIWELSHNLEQDVVCMKYLETVYPISKGPVWS